MILSEMPLIDDIAQARFFNLTDGLILWDLGVLQPHSPEAPSTVRLPVRWGPEAQCPHIDAFLAEVVGPDCLPLLEEIAG